MNQNSTLSKHFNRIEGRALFMNEKVKERLIIFAFFALQIWGLVFPVFNVRFMVIYLVGGLFMLVILLSTLQLPLKRRALNVVPVVAWTSFGLLALVMGMVYNENYLLNGVWYLFVFPVFWLVLQSYGDYEWIFALYARSSLWAFGLFFLISVLFFPPLAEYYISFLRNTNTLAQILQPMFMGILYSYTLLLEEKSTKKNIFLHFFLLVFCIGMILLSTSRTGMIAMIAIFLVWLTYLFLNRFRLQYKRIIFAVASVLLASVISLPVSAFMFPSVNRVVVSTFPEINKAVVSFLYAPEDEYELVVFQEEQYQEDKQEDSTTGVISFVNDVLKRFKIKLHRMIEGDARLQIWRNYMQALSIAGAKAPLIGLGDRPGTAHNAIFQYTYDYGIFGGIAYLIFFVSTGVLCLRYLFKRRNRCALFSAMAVGGYAVTSMLASTTSPFSYHLVFVYLLAQIYLLEKEPEKRMIEENAGRTNNE